MNKHQCSDLGEVLNKARDYHLMTGQDAQWYRDSSSLLLGMATVNKSDFWFVRLTQVQRRFSSILNLSNEEYLVKLITTPEGQDKLGCAINDRLEIHEINEAHFKNSPSWTVHQVMNS